MDTWRKWPQEIRPAVLYVAEKLATKKRQENRIDANEIRILYYRVDVRSDTVQRQDEERTHASDNMRPKRSQRED